MDEKRGIGKNGKIPWHIPEDLKRFRQITSGYPVIMGRKTFESIGRPLPNRTNIVITHSAGLARPRLARLKGCIVAYSLEDAIEKARKPEVLRVKHLGGVTATTPRGDELFIIGGGQIYAQAIDLADKLYLTIVEGTYDADTFFPDYSEFTKVISEEKHQSDQYKYTFLDVER